MRTSFLFASLLGATLLSAGASRAADPAKKAAPSAKADGAKAPAAEGGALPPNAQAAASSPKNLKLLPAGMKGEALLSVMKNFGGALGVDCAFCHDTGDYSKDEKKHKRVSRDMMKATMAFNQQLFKGKPEVTCMTCHRGKEEPEVH
jgi:hypothetical protein